MNDSSYRLELTCPQCGGPVELEETDRIFGCPFCRVRLYVHCRGVCRYYLQPRSSLESEGTLFVPYWRFKGLGYALNGLSVRHKVIDATTAAVAHKAFPLSLGVRPQALTLRFLVPSVRGVFLEPDMGRRDLLTHLGTIHLGVGRGRGGNMFSQAFVGEVFSLIYAPFVVRDGKLFDGITGKRLGNMAGSEALPAARERGGKEPMSFVPTMCPQCGWDMQGDRGSLVLTCPHCDTVWSVRGAGLKPVRAAFYGDGSGSDLWLPFWRMQVEARELPLCSQGDFFRLTRLPRVVTPSQDEQPFAAWTPAFKLRPDTFLRLGRQMTLGMMGRQTRSPDRLPGEAFYPVSLPMEEGKQSLPILIGDMTPAKRVVFPRLHECRFGLKEATLVYLPFRKRGSEMLQPELGFALSASTLRWGKWL